MFVCSYLFPIASTNTKLNNAVLFLTKSECGKFFYCQRLVLNPGKDYVFGMLKFSSADLSFSFFIVHVALNILK